MNDETNKNNLEAIVDHGPECVDRDAAIEACEWARDQISNLHGMVNISANATVEYKRQLEKALAGIKKLEGMVEELGNEWVYARDKHEAIVSKLPWCWGLDGGALVRDVPVTPGMTVYIIEALIVSKAIVVFPVGTGHVRCEAGHRYEAKMLYDSPVSAQAKIDGDNDG